MRHNYDKLIGTEYFSEEERTVEERDYQEEARDDLNWFEIALLTLRGILVFQESGCFSSEKEGDKWRDDGRWVEVFIWPGLERVKIEIEADFRVRRKMTRKKVVLWLVQPDSVEPEGEIEPTEGEIEPAEGEPVEGEEPAEGEEPTEGEIEELRIVEAPSSISVCRGKAFSLSVEVAGGVPPYSYTWFKGEDEEMTNAEQVGTEAVYAVASASRSDEGFYWAQVTDSGNQKMVISFQGRSP